LSSPVSCYHRSLHPRSANSFFFSWTSPSARHRTTLFVCIPSPEDAVNQRLFSPPPPPWLELVLNRHLFSSYQSLLVRLIRLFPCEPTSIFPSFVRQQAPVFLDASDVLPKRSLLSRVCNFSRSSVFKPAYIPPLRYFPTSSFPLVVPSLSLCGKKPCSRYFPHNLFFCRCARGPPRVLGVPGRT